MGEYIDFDEQATVPSVTSDFVSVLIVGAGSTGLAIAQGLKKAGVSCIVFEKHGALDAQSRDWNMGLHWGASDLKGLISDNAWENIQSVQVDPSKPTAENDALKFIQAKSGELLSSIPVQNFYRLRRSKLRALLSNGLNIQYGKKLKNIELPSDGKSAKIYFEDGSSASGGLVIGADGARSNMRKLLLGPKLGEIRHLPYVATFVQAKFTAEQALYLRKFHPLYLAGIHPSGYFSFFGMHDAPDPSKPETWTFFFYISWKSSLAEQDKTANWSNQQRMKQLKSISTQKEFCDPWKSALEWVDDNHEVWHMSLTDFDPGAEGHVWNNHGGRVTMAGDAVHPMTYQRGQGLNHSVTDAANLVKAINDFVSGKTNQDTAISSYEEEMIARAGGEVRLSTVNTEMLHDWQKVLLSPVLNAGMKHKH